MSLLLNHLFFTRILSSGCMWLLLAWMHSIILNNGCKFYANVVLPIVKYEYNTNSSLSNKQESTKKQTTSITKGKYNLHKGQLKRLQNGCTTKCQCYWTFHLSSKLNSFYEIPILFFHFNFKTFDYWDNFEKETFSSCHHLRRKHLKLVGIKMY